MRAPVLSAIVLGAVAAASSGATPRVHRCLGEHGETAFSDAPCAAAADAPAAAIAESAPRACPASREALRDRMAEAITQHDANALAGLLRWRGVGSGAARADLRALRELAERPLLSIDADDDGRTGLRVRTGGGEAGGTRELRFDVAADGGCYWLTW
ncbi:MAG TPA: hypothetical protein VGC30_13830 [Dokdonella sp.]